MPISTHDAQGNLLRTPGTQSGGCEFLVIPLELKTAARGKRFFWRPTGLHYPLTDGS